VGHLHKSNAVAIAVLKFDAQPAVTVKAFHAASNSLILLAYGWSLFSVVRGSSGLTAFIEEGFT